MFYLVWKNEIVEECNSRDEAEKMQIEYNMAYRGGVSICLPDEVAPTQLENWNS